MRGPRTAASVHTIIHAENFGLSVHFLFSINIHFLSVDIRTDVSCRFYGDEALADGIGIVYDRGNSFKWTTLLAESAYD